MKLRRCKEDREDFTNKDGNFWPIQIEKGGGPSFSFCPGKATWSEDAAEAMRLIETTYFLKQPLFPGCFFDQPWWYGELIDECLPLYEIHRENAKQRQMWGGGDTKAGKQTGNAGKRGAKRSGRRKL
jgi:hypothetical protein